MNSSDSTIVHSILRHVESDANRIAFTFLNDRAEMASETSLGELHRAAMGIAESLPKLGGKRVLLLFGANLQFVRALLGCMYAGAVPVPAPLPTRQLASRSRLLGIVRDAAPTLVLTEAAYEDQISTLLGDAGISQVALISTDAIPNSSASLESAPRVDSLALLQYTSGSTGLPKGVMVSHRALQHNMGSIEKGFGHSPETLVASWLPMFHDMGLIGKVLHPLYLGVQSVHLTPLAFLKRPAVWLQAISTYRITTSGAPNFAYEHCTSRISDEHLDGIDLSSWSVAFSGSEPIRSETMRAFSDRFKPNGFRPNARFCCYGLAESTLFVTGSTPLRGPTFLTVDAEVLAGGVALPVSNDAVIRARTLVGSGATNDLDIAVVDPVTTEEVPERRVGEIWIRGDSVTEGYWDNESATSEAFNWSLSGSGGWLRTGDLGFAHNGELFVTGRIKEVMIVNGRNLHPHDLEHSVQTACATLREGAGAAFSIDTGGSEGIVLLQELARGSHPNLELLARNIHEVVSQEFGVRLEGLALLPPSMVRKTTSGKVMRREMRRLFLDGDLATIYEEISDRLQRFRTEASSHRLTGPATSETTWI